MSESSFFFFLEGRAGSSSKSGAGSSRSAASNSARVADSRLTSLDLLTCKNLLAKASEANANVFE